MSCAKYEAWILDAAAGELPAVRAAELEAHLETCNCCREAFDRERALFAQIDAGLAAAVAGAPLPGFAAGVYRRLESETAARPLRSLAWLPVFAGALAAVLLVVVWATRLGRVPTMETAVLRQDVASIVPQQSQRAFPGAAAAAPAQTQPVSRRLREFVVEVKVAREEAAGALWLARTMRRPGTNLPAVLADESAAQAERSKPIQLAALHFSLIEISPLRSNGESEKPQTP